MYTHCSRERHCFAIDISRTLEEGMREGWRVGYAEEVVADGAIFPPINFGRIVHQGPGGDVDWLTHEEEVSSEGVHSLVVRYGDPNVCCVLKEIARKGHKYGKVATHQTTGGCRNQHVLVTSVLSEVLPLIFFSR